MDFICASAGVEQEAVYNSTLITGGGRQAHAGASVYERPGGHACPATGRSKQRR